MSQAGIAATEFNVRIGLLALGAAQGLTEKELYHEALAFNAFWFSTN